MYERIVEWGIWFEPIIKGLLGIALIKYIILDW